MSTGKCSPNISGVIGTVTFNCTDPNTTQIVNELIKDSNKNAEDLCKITKAIESLRADFINIKRNIGPIKGNDKKIEDLKQTISKHEKEFDNIWEDLQTQRKIFFSRLDDLREDMEGIVSKDSEELRRHLEQNDQYLRRDIDQLIMDYRTNLEILNIRLDGLESKVTEIMHRIDEVDFKGNIFFYGLTVGGLELDDEWHSRIAGEIEIFNPKFTLFEQPGSVFMEVIHLQWEESRSFDTLPGLPEREVTTNHDMTYLGLGMRLIALSWPEKHIYGVLSVSGGNTIAGEEDTFYYSVGGAVEFVRRSVRIAIETRWEAFQSIEKTNITFDPFGDANLSIEEEEQGGLYLGVRLSFR
jgi:hypothetical protein